MIPLRDDNPVRITPLVTYGIVGLCALVFLWQITLGRTGGQIAVYALGLVPAVLLGHAQLPQQAQWVPSSLTVLTSMFLHGGLLHIGGNLLYLWIFADNIEEDMGHVRFLFFYLICGVAAAMSQALPDPTSTVPMIGASGAISGVLGAYMLRFPRAHVLVVLPIPFILQLLRLPALAVLGFWFLVQLFSNAGAAGGGGVAFRAHIGGFLTGMLLLPLFSRAHLRGLLGRRR